MLSIVLKIEQSRIPVRQAVYRSEFIMDGYAKELNNKQCYQIRETQKKQIEIIRNSYDHMECKQ